MSEYATHVPSRSVSRRNLVGERDDTNPPNEMRDVTLRVLGVFAMTRLALVMATYYGATVAHVGGATGLLSGWDGQHYLAIAQYGYPRHPDLLHYSVVGFFPGYPLVVRFVYHVLHLSPLGAGLLVSLVAASGLVVVATRLVALVWGHAAGERAGILLCVFPGSFVLNLPYAESLALVLAALALLAIEDGRAILAGCCAALATFTSPVMLALVPAFAGHAWRTRRAVDWLAASLSTAGFLAYTGYLWVHTSSPLAWFQEESHGFGHHFSLFTAFDYLQRWPGIGLLESTSLVVMIWGVLALRRSGAPLEWALYSAFVMVTVIFDAALWVNPRFLLNAFPLLLAIGVWSRRELWRSVTLAFAALLPVVFLAYMTIGSVTAQP